MTYSALFTSTAWETSTSFCCGFVMEYQNSRDPRQNMEYDPHCVSIGKCITKPGGWWFEIGPATHCHTPDRWLFQASSQTVNNYQHWCTLCFFSSAKQNRCTWLFSKKKKKIKGVSMKCNNQNVTPYDCLVHLGVSVAGGWSVLFLDEPLVDNFMFASLLWFLQLFLGIVWLH